MAAVNFPNNPSVNDTHTSSGSTWKWDGTVWQRLGVAGPQGAQGVQGATGSGGAAGAQGAQGRQGASGSNGAAGAQGAQGHQGVQGAANATTINNNANNRIITGSGTANTLEAESNLTYDGTRLSMGNNIVFGDSAGSGNYSVSIGRIAGYSNPSQYNVNIGYGPGYSNAGSYSINIGEYAGYNNAGDYAVNIGRRAGYNSGDYSINIGYMAGLSDNNGQANIAIGKEALEDDNGQEYCIGIGASCTLPIRGENTGASDNQLVIGVGQTAWIVGTKNYNIGLGVTNPNRMLHIKGTGNALVKMEGDYSGSVTGIEGVLTASGANRYVTGVYGKVVNTSGSESNVASIRLWNEQASPTTSDSPGYITFNTTNNNASTATEKVRITSDGKFGVGIDDPTGLLHIQSNNPTFRISDANQATDNKTWNISGGNVQVLRIQALNDSGGGGSQYFDFYRDGNSVQEFRGLKGGNTWFVVNNNTNKVGIGTDDLYSTLTAYGENKSDTGSATGQITAKDNAAYNANPTGGLVFQGHFANNNANAVFGGITGFKENATDGNYAGALAFHVRANGAVAYEALRITSAGQVLIGTATAGASNLMIYGDGTTDNKPATNYQNSVTGTGTGNGFYVGINHNDAVGYVWNYENQPLVFATNNSERLRIDSSGNIGQSVTPSGWASAQAGDFYAYQIGTGIAVFGRGSGDEDRGGISANYYNTGSAQKYIGNGHAGRMYFEDGSIVFSNAAQNSAGAGAAMTLNERLRITSTGLIGIGDNSPTVSLSFKRNQTSNHYARVENTNTNSNYTGLSLKTPTVDCQIWNQGPGGGGYGGTNSMNFYQAGTYGPFAFYHGTDERLRIDTTGALGLGAIPKNNTGNYRQLQIGLGAHFYGRTDDTPIYISSNAYRDGSNWKYTANTTASQMGMGTHITFYTASSGTAGNNISWTDAMRLENDGDWMIGSDWSNTLWDSGSESGVFYRKAQGSFAMATPSSTGYSNWYMNKNTGGGTSDNRWIDFYYNGTSKDKIWYNNSGNVAFGGYSDYRLKENITEMDDGIVKVKQLKPSYYTWKKGHGRDECSDIKQSGFIAHEIQSVLPTLVDGTKDQVVTQEEFDAGTQPEESTVGTPIYQSVDYQKITPILTAAIKELITKVETLEAEVAALKSG